MSWVEITFPEARAQVLAEVTEDTARGLMGRTSLPEGYGMLLDMRVEGLHRFWMKNVAFGLDVLFLGQFRGDLGTVVGIIEHAQPYDVAERGINEPSRCMLEVPAGWCQRHGIVAGQMVVVPGAGR